MHDAPNAVSLPHMDTGAILERVERRLKVVGLSADAASRSAGKPDAIRNMKRAVKRDEAYSVTISTLNALAPVLETTAEWLLAGAGPEAPGGTGSEPTPAKTENGTDLAVRSPASTRLVPVVGSVQAGTWREEDDFPEDAFEPMEVAPDPDYPHARQAIWHVRGDSMDQADPPMPDGSKAVCVDWEDIREVLEDGMIVVVERTRDGGHMREVSIKEVKFFEDRTEFHPRSSNPRHRPIVVPRDPKADDGTTVRVLALLSYVLMMPRRRR